MELTKEKALELHRKMWTAMQKELGDNPSFDDRWGFKTEWVARHFPSEQVKHNCFLCEYAIKKDGHCTDVNMRVCKQCPLEWTSGFYYNTCETTDDYSCDNERYCDWRYSPISDILKLPVRK